MNVIQYSNGATRFVIQIPALGIVIKVAKMSVWMAFKVSFSYFVRNDEFSKRTRHKWFKRTSTVYGGSTLGYELFRGVDSNALEYSVWKKYKFTFLQPTYCSFFGLINIQKYGEPLSKELGGIFFSEDVFTHNTRLTNYAWRQDNHTLFGGSNYTINHESKGIILLDYGSLKTIKVILKFKEEFQKTLLHAKIS